MSKLFNISEVSKFLKLINPVTKKPTNYILRYWEKEFKQIKPLLINNRRYYTEKQIEKLKLIKYLLKDKGLTINGVKSILKSKENSSGGLNINQLKVDYRRQKIKNIGKTIISKIDKLKKYGKKTHIKVRLVPESNPDSKFIYYAKKPTKGEKVFKEKLKLKKYNPNTRKHEIFIEKITS